MNRTVQLCVVLACFGTSALAQQPGSAMGAQSSVSQPATMTFDVVVTDKAGHPIPGLQEGDFTLLDNRQPAAIRSFAAYSRSMPQKDAVTAVLVIDGVNEGFNAVSVARTQIGNLLRSHDGQLPFPMSIALFTDTAVKPLTPVSSDGNVLANKLQQQQGQLRDLNRSAGFWGAAERLSASLRAVELLARAEADTPGRKLLIWVSPGWPIFDNPNVIVGERQEHDIFGEIVALSNTLRENQITLYAVDPLGSWDAGSFRTFLWQSFVKPVRTANQANPSNLALQVLAVQSGGKVLSGSNDVAGEIEQCMEDGSAWYTLSFDAQGSDKPNTWHDIEVKVDKPGLTVRTRNGYYAQP